MTADWRSQAACRGTDPDWWFPERGSSAVEQKAVCAGCPVRQPCLEVGMYERLGIWGGLAERERRRLRQNLAPERSAGGCGTLAGYVAHRKAGEPVCDACRAVENAYQRERYEVARVARTRLRRPPAEHGTVDGFRSHLRRSEPACDPCREAWSTAWRTPTGKTEETSGSTVLVEVA